MIIKCVLTVSILISSNINCNFNYSYGVSNARQQDFFFLFYELKTSDLNF